MFRTFSNAVIKFLTNHISKTWILLALPNGSWSVTIVPLCIFCRSIHAKSLVKNALHCVMNTVTANILTKRCPRAPTTVLKSNRLRIICDTSRTAQSNDIQIYWIILKIAIWKFFRYKTFAQTFCRERPLFLWVQRMKVSGATVKQVHPWL